MVGTTKVLRIAYKCQTLIPMRKWVDDSKTTLCILDSGWWWFHNFLERVLVEEEEWPVWW